MQSDISAPLSLFDGKTHYEIPVFQRPYVWDEENQWEPLWNDVVRLAKKIANAGDDADAVPSHFLGAVVLKARPVQANKVTRFEVVDGQQRLTTIQIIMAAAHAVLSGYPEFEDEAESLKELTTNSASRFRGTPFALKLNPSRGDRAAFQSIFGLSSEDDVEDHRITKAFNYFQERICSWVEAEEDAEGIQMEDRVSALSETLQNKLAVANIDLDGSDDDQLIFETLNDRGTPLLKADLIKNWIFERGEKLGADVEEWADKYWQPLDEEWWREEVRVGRAFRSRIDVFLQYWLTSKKNDEITSRDVFATFRDFAVVEMESATTARRLLRNLSRDAGFYRSLSEGSESGPVGRFHRIIIQEFDLAAFFPLVLRLSSPSNTFADSQVEKAYRIFESWVVRRTLLRATTKGINQLVVVLLKEIERAGDQNVGDICADFLSVQESPARYWPTDGEVMKNAPSYRVYGYIRQNRLRVILSGVEKFLRTSRSESVSLPENLQIEHLMPVQWRDYWDSVPPRTGEAVDEINEAINQIGNLTLVTGKLNGSLSNQPWVDTTGTSKLLGGVEVRAGKRELIDHFSLLVLNKAVVESNPDEWTVKDIRARSEEIIGLVCQVWPRTT